LADCLKIAWGIAAVAGLMLATPGLAADNPPTGNANAPQQLDVPDQYYQQQIDAQQKLIEQRAKLVKQLQDLAKDQDQRINKLEQALTQPQPTVTPAVSSAQTVAISPPAPTNTQIGQTQSDQTQPGTQGAPSEELRQVKVANLPQYGGVLLPEGKFSLEPSIEYDHASTTQLTFQGTSIAEGVLIGAINASDVRDDTVIGALTGYYGVTDRLELEAKVPYVYRSNSEIDSLGGGSNFTSFQRSISGNDLGDIEFAAHYQINDGLEDWPIFVGNFRYKSDTGTSPFDVGFTQSGLPESLATGTGFNTIEPGVSVFYPLDPVVLFGAVEYDYSFPIDVNKLVAGQTVGHVTPGWAVGGTLGMGIAMNQKLSAIIGYQHYYVAPTNEKVVTVINGGAFPQSLNSQALQVGSFLLGGAYQLTPSLGLNFQTLIGATRDAPDVRVIFRVPYTFDIY
jgi:hypothetical protein